MDRRPPATPGGRRPNATDPRTADFPLERWSASPTLEADWWPEGQEQETTQLCGRWWVSEDDGTFYAFGAELV